MGQHLDGGWLRRGSMVAASLLAASGLLAACGSSSTKAASTTSSSASSKPVTITFMQRESTSVLKPYLVHLTDEFNSTHKDIKVELEFEPSENVLHEKEEAAIAAGDPPTLGQVGQGWAAAYQASNAIVPLGPFVHGKNGLSAKELADVWPGMIQESKVHGKLWSWPFNESVWVMFYDKQMAASLHLSPPKTWSELLADAKEIPKVDPGHWAFSINPLEIGDDLALIMAESYGSEPTKDGKPSLDGPGDVDALSLLQKLYASGGLKLGTDYPGETAFTSERSVFHLTTTNGYYYDLKGAKGKFTIDTAPIPVGPGGKVGNMVGGNNVVIFAHTTKAEQAAAWEYLKWLTEPEQTAYWATHTGYLPVTKAAVPLIQSYLKTHDYKRIGVEELASAPGEPETPNFSEAAQDFGNAIEKVLLEHQSPAVALAAAQKKALAQLSK